MQLADGEGKGAEGERSNDTPEVSAAQAFEPVKTIMTEGVREGVFPGAVLYVGRLGKLIYRGAFGHKSQRAVKADECSPMGIDTVFDVAGITAGMITATSIMRLVEEGRLRLEDRVSRYLQGFGVLGKSAITIGHLLSHTSGLAHWHPFYEELIRENDGARMGILTSKGAREYVLNSILRSSLKGEVGTKYLYSDVGLVLLGFIIEAVTGMTLERAAQSLVLQPLRLRSTSFIDLSRIKSGSIHPVTDLIAPTEECPWRNRVVWGEVHDDNAWAIGGIAGNSGLFATAGDVHIFAREMLYCYEGKSPFLKRSTMELFLKGLAIPASGTTVKLGWDSPNRENGMIDSGLSPSAFGYNGFTGCSVWIDPQTGYDMVLMSNRVHPLRSNKKIQTFRPEVYRAVHEAMSRISF